jgi:serine/threonine protein kinase
METLTGETLAHLIEESPRRLPVTEIAHLGLHLGAAVRYLHVQGWLHLDLKPSNIITEAGRAKLIDMSVARRPGRAPAGVGTWCYMAPEQARGGHLGPSADVWGLGAVLYEATTGHSAFDPTGAGDDDADERPYRQLDGPPPPVRRLRRGAPAALVALISACLAPEPAGRPPLREVLRALEPLAGIPPRERRFRRGATR